MKRKSKTSYSYDQDNDRDFDDYAVEDKSAKRKSLTKPFSFSMTALAVLAGVFILGIGVGVGFYSTAGSSVAGSKIDNAIQIEAQVPDREFCVQYGAAAITLDARLFVTLNPFSVYVSQPITRPGCVVRTSNWSVLEQKGLVKPDQVRDCRERLNTFGYTGSVNNSPQIDCVYQNDAAKNLFLNPGSGAPEIDRFK
jgi:hypothetical protein